MPKLSGRTGRQGQGQLPFGLLIASGMFNRLVPGSPAVPYLGACERCFKRGSIGFGAIGDSFEASGKILCQCIGLRWAAEQAGIRLGYRRRGSGGAGFVQITLKRADGGLQGFDHLGIDRSSGAGRRLGPGLARISQFIGKEQRGKQQVLRFKWCARSAELCVFFGDHRPQPGDVRFLPISADNGVAFWTDRESYGAHQASLFQLGQNVIKFAKGFRHLFTQLFMGVDQADHPRRSGSGLPARVTCGITRSFDPLQRGFDAFDRAFDTLGTHWLMR